MSNYIYDSSGFHELDNNGGYKSGLRSIHEIQGMAKIFFPSIETISSIVSDHGFQNRVKRNVSELEKMTSLFYGLSNNDMILAGTGDNSFAFEVYSLSLISPADELYSQFYIPDSSHLQGHGEGIEWILYHQGFSSRKINILSEKDVTEKEILDVLAKTFFVDPIANTPADQFTVKEYLRGNNELRSQGIRLALEQRKKQGRFR